MKVTDTIWLLLILLLFLDLLFAALRASFVHARPPQLLTLDESYASAVDSSLKLLEKPHFLATLRLNVSLMHFLLGGVIYMTLVGVELLPPGFGAIVLAMLLTTLVVLSFEFAAEGLVLRQPERWAARLSSLARMLDLLWRPVTWFLMTLMGSPQSLQRSRTLVTDDELKIWVENGESEGNLEHGERKMIYSIFQFGDTLCREIMVPRIDVFALDVNTSLEEAIKVALHSGHSRLPVYEENIDNIIGLLYAKDLLRLQLEGEENVSIRSLLRQAYFVPEAKKVDELLREMQARGVHMSIVVDEYGGMAGLVTLEDIVEEIVGEIRDEYDEGEELLYQQESADEYRFLGRIDLDDFNEILGTHLTKEVADTLGGFIYAQIGRVPVGGEELEVEDWKVKVEQVSGRRIRTVRASRKSGLLATEMKGDGTES